MKQRRLEHCVECFEWVPFKWDLRKVYGRLTTIKTVCMLRKCEVLEPPVTYSANGCVALIGHNTCNHATMLHLFRAENFQRWIGMHMLP